MRPAVLLTAFDRPGYLRRTLAAWTAVRGATDWHLLVAVEPGDATDEVLAIVEQHRLGFGTAETVVNERRLGVAENPYRHLGALVADGYDFVLRAEDDLIVADDVLELAAFAAGHPEPSVAAFCAFSDLPWGEAAALTRRTAFSPWVWGTWADRWRDLIGPTWDRDYSTFNGSPGFEAGWDWNLNTRVLPAHGLRVFAPLQSRVRNIGEFGVHGTPELLVASPGFAAHVAAGPYRIS